MFRRNLTTCILIGLLATSLRGEVFEFELEFDQAPTSMYMDRWMYPFNTTPGDRRVAPTFGAVGAAGTDERDGQLVIGINTDELGIPTGAPPMRYQIESVRLVLTETVGGYAFDPTYDTFQTYLAPETSIAQSDLDAGRPVELYGLGFRNGFERLGWPDGGTSTEEPVFSAGSPFGVSGRSTRNVFAIDASGNDVSNQLDSLNDGIHGFDTTPFSVGQAYVTEEKPLAPTDEVMAGMMFQFELDLSNASIEAYLQNGLARGQIGFVISSLHDAGLQGAGDPYVNLATAKHFAESGPKFEITVTVDEAMLEGDFDMSGLLDVGDVDFLVEEIKQENHSPEFDTNGDNQVDHHDLSFWVRELFDSYLGDANLDGRFNSRDFVEVFAAGEYEDQVANNSTWSTGDWNADGEFDSRDFVAAFQDGGYELPARSRIAVVPEPTSLGLLGMIGCGLVGLHRRRRSR